MKPDYKFPQIDFYINNQNHLLLPAFSKQLHSVICIYNDYLIVRNILNLESRVVIFIMYI